MRFDPRNPAVLPVPFDFRDDTPVVSMKMNEIWYSNFHGSNRLDLVFRYWEDPDDHLYGWRHFTNGVEDVSQRRPSRFLDKKKAER